MRRNRQDLSATAQPPGQYPVAFLHRENKERNENEHKLVLVSTCNQLSRFHAGKVFGYLVTDTATSPNNIDNEYLKID
jgi:hypothetical protein